MRTYLAVDKLEPPSSIGDLLTQAGGKLSQHVPVFASRSFGIPVQLCDLAREQRMPLSIQRGNVALSMLNLARDAKKLGSSAFAGDGSINLAMIVQQTLQRLSITTAVSLIGTSHQQRKVPLLVVIARKVRMYALSHVAEEGLQARRRIKLLSLASLAERGIMGLLRLPAGLLGSTPRRAGVIKGDLALSNPRLQLIELSIENAHLAKIPSFKSLKLRPNLGKFRFALSQRSANASKLLTPVEQCSVVRSLLEDDFGWHEASREG
jgi:hypothetical protein